MLNDANDIPWDSLKYFVAVATAGSLRRAAEALGISAATLSRHVQSLEEGFGCQLFHRRSNGFEMTEEGRAILDRCLGIDAMVRTLMTSVVARNRAKVRISTLPCIGKFAVLPLLAEFLESHPDTLVDVAWDGEEPDDFCWDLAIRASRPDQGRFVVRRLGHLELATYARMLEGGPVRLPDDLPTIVIGRDRRGDEAAGRPNVHLEDYHSLVDAVRAGIGKGTMADFVARRYPELRRLPDPSGPERREIWLVMREEAARRSEVRHLADLVATRVVQELRSAPAATFAVGAGRSPEEPGRRHVPAASSRQIASPLA